MILPGSQFGITGSLDNSKKNNDNLTESLEKYLTEQHIYETENELIERERVLGKISFLFNQFVISVLQKRKIQCGTTESKIFTFGSYRLGVHSRGADIDTLCVGPKYLERVDFFKDFADILIKHGFEVDKVEDAYVPLMQLTFKMKEQSSEINDNRGDILETNSNTSIDHHLIELDTNSTKRLKLVGEDGNFQEINLEKDLLKENKISKDKDISEAKEISKKLSEKDDVSQNKNNSSISTNNIANNDEHVEIKIDLLYSRLNLPHIDSSLDLKDSKLLKNLDEKSVLSLNGNRVADDILHLVPNIRVFHGALRCIKYWSKRKQINGHLFGYPGGIAYAILVARICQLFPHYDVTNIILKFFELYKDWKWPAPIQLNKIENLNFNYKVWDPSSNPSDRFHKMPIITPSYPAMCSTHNIFPSTLKRFKDECVKAYEILKNTDQTNKISDSSTKDTNIWPVFFKQTDFFQKFKNYLVVYVIASSNQTEDSTAHFKMWQGHVSSRLRFLGSKLEMVSECESAPPFPQNFDISPFIDKLISDKFFSSTIVKKEDHCSLLFLGLELDESHEISKKKVQLNEPIKEFRDLVYEWKQRNGSENIHVSVMKRKNINLFLKKIHEYGKSE